MIPHKKDISKNNQWERIWLLAKIEFKLRYYENKLGLVWALIKPLMQLVIYFIAFKVILKNDIPDYSFYLFSGLIVWQFFMEATTGLTVILKTKRYLYEYSNMSKIEIYLASLISVSLGFVFNFSILLLILGIAGFSFGINIVFVPIIFLVLFILCLGISMVLSNLFLIAKDINQIWPLVAQLFMWLSPLFLSFDALYQNVPGIEFLNPMFGIMTNFRSAVMYNELPNLYFLLINFAHAIILFSIGYLLLTKIGRKASEML